MGNLVRRAWRNIQYLLFGLQRSLKRIDAKLECIMTKQEDLDAIVGRIDTAVSGIRNDITELKAAHPEVDFSQLEERVTGLEGLDAENPGGETPTPTR